MIGNVLSAFLHDFLILFGMVNVIGNIPHISAMTIDENPGQKRRTFALGSLTAMCIILVFALSGNFLLISLFDVSFSSFKIAGGIVVFIVSMRGVVLGPIHAMPPLKKGSPEYSFMSVAFPFLVGPGTMVTGILLMQGSGKLHTSLVTLAVYASAFLILLAIPVIEKMVGKVIMLLVSRILYIFIAAKATTFIITGLKECFR
jgi:multiple antibiotic resistance protein